mgnify:CR=1 FL=1
MSHYRNFKTKFLEDDYILLPECEASFLPYQCRSDASEYGQDRH